MSRHTAPNTSHGEDFPCPRCSGPLWVGGSKLAAVHFLLARHTMWTHLWAILGLFLLPSATQLHEARGMSWGTSTAIKTVVGSVGVWKFGLLTHAAFWWSLALPRSDPRWTTSTSQHIAAGTSRLRTWWGWQKPASNGKFWLRWSLEVSGSVAPSLPRSRSLPGIVFQTYHSLPRWPGFLQNSKCLYCDSPIGTLHKLYLVPFGTADTSNFHRVCQIRRPEYHIARTSAWTWALSCSGYHQSWQPMGK